MTAFLSREVTPIPARESKSENQRWDSFLQRYTPRGLRRESGTPVARLFGKRVLVTGAGGWIGSALVRSIAQSDACELVLLDSAEGALHEVTQSLLEINGVAKHTTVLASVCDRHAVEEMFHRHRPEIVFHAGAFKHVPLMESNPFAAVANNALGTHILVEAAAKFDCAQMVMVSTDKAVDPFSIMGASKRIAELVMLAPRPCSMRRKAVRLGNVLGSSGSVGPLFLRQIARGGPVTVSHPDVRRYFMTLNEAVDALLDAVSPDCPDGLLAPELGESIRVLDLAKHLIAQQHPGLNRFAHKGEVPIVFTALRPGDKMEESLISTRESYADGPEGLLRTIRTPEPGPAEFDIAMSQLRQAVQQRDLNLLLEAVLLLVPEYQPSLLLRVALSSASSTAVNA